MAAPAVKLDDRRKQAPVENQPMPAPPLMARWRWLDRLIRAGFQYGLLCRWLAVRDIWVVGKRRPITDLTPEQQRQVRTAYRDTGWSSDYSVEMVGTFTQEIAARRAASIPGGFYHQLPLNAGLPDFPIQYGKHDFPLSSDRATYEQPNCEIIAARRCDVERVVDLATQVKHSSARLMNST